MVENLLFICFVSFALNVVIWRFYHNTMRRFLTTAFISVASGLAVIIIGDNYIFGDAKTPAAPIFLSLFSTVISMAAGGIVGIGWCYVSLIMKHLKVWESVDERAGTEEPARPLPCGSRAG